MSPGRRPARRPLPSRRRRAWLLAAACCASPLGAQGVGEGPQEARRDLWTLSRAAAAARDAGDWPRAQEAYAEALAVAPGHPGLHVRMAEALARRGDLEGALASLERAAGLGGVTDLLADPLFAPVAASERARRLAARLAANARPPAPAEVVTRFADRELFPEGIAIDPTTGELFVGSYHRGLILRVGPGGAVSTLGDPARQGLRAVLGLWVDAARRELWAVSGEREGAAGGPPPELVRLSLPEGAVAGRYSAPVDGVERLLNDVVVTPDGTAWATESLQGGLYRVPAGGEALELFRTYPDLGFANGIAAAADGATLWVAHAEGLTAIDAATGEATRVAAPEDLSLVGADGLSLAPGGLVLVQNQPSLGNRAIFVALEPGGRAARGHRLLAAGLPDGLLPFTSAVGGGWVYLVASAPFDGPGGSGQVPRPAVVRCPLPSLP